MKPAMLLAVILSAIAAGGASGFLATQFIEEPESPAAQIALEHDADEPKDFTDDIRKQSARISVHDDDIDALRSSLADAEAGMVDEAALLKRIDVLNARIAALEARKPTVEATKDGEPDPEADVLKAAVAEAMEEAEVKRRAERDAERREGASRWMSRGNDRILTTLSDKLNLSEVQKETIKAQIDEYSKKRIAVMTKGMEARRNGEEFDWREEMTTVSTEATDAIRLELSSAQASTFDELVGDEGISSLGGGFGRGRNRGGNRDSDNGDGG